MLAINEPARSIRGAVQYNEQKVEEGQALFLDAHNFLPEKEELTIWDKLQRFRDLDSLNERSRKHCTHISVNFPPKDVLSDLQMKRIATDFMQAIDFGDQPWLLYRHIDVGHPHMHIVSTNIRFDGSRISNDLRSPHHLKQICFQLEERYGLTPVFEMPDLFGEQEVKPQQEQYRHGGPQRITYGEKPTRTAMSEVLEYVNKEYSFTSFDAYNAMLSLYNVRADRGREQSAMYQNKGLYSRVIDERGQKLGAPIKASAFHLPVTMERLEEKFELSRQRVQESIPGIRVNVDWVLHGNPQPYSLSEFSRDLKENRIDLVIPALRQSDPRGWQQRVTNLLDKSLPDSEKIAVKPDDGHGFFYVNWSHKAIVRDTQAGDKYTADAVLQRTGIDKQLHNMHRDRYFKLSNAQEAILRPDYPDTAQARRLLLRLSPSHDKVVEKQLELRNNRNSSCAIRIGCIMDSEARSPSCLTARTPPVCARRQDHIPARP